MKRLISALTAFAAIAFSQSAIAQTVSYKNSGLDAVVTFEGTPNAPFSGAIWSQKERAITVNPCGLAIVPTAENIVQFVQIVGGASIPYSDLPTQNLVTCSGGTLSEPRPNNFKLADGKTVLVAQTPGASISVQYLARSARTGTFNACGFKSITIKNWEANGADSIPIDFGGQTQALGDLNRADAPICKKVGGNSVKYIKL